MTEQKLEHSLSIRKDINTIKDIKIFISDLRNRTDLKNTELSDIYDDLNSRLELELKILDLKFKSL